MVGSLISSHMDSALGSLILADLPGKFCRYVGAKQRHYIALTINYQGTSFDRMINYNKFQRNYYGKLITYIKIKVAKNKLQ